MPADWIRSSMRRPEVTVASSTITTVAPREKDDHRSNVDRSKWNGATLDTRSSSRSPTQSAAHSVKARAFRWESITPFGTPVEPDV